MKRRLVAVVLCLLLGLLSGCGWVQNEYRTVSEHKEPSVLAESETEPVIPSATDTNSLISVILSLVYDGSAQNLIDVSEFQGDVRQDIATVMARLSVEPVYAYAVDYTDYDVVEQDGTEYLKIDMVYRRSAEEIAAIVDAGDMDKARSLINVALNNFDVAITLKIAGFSNIDFAAYVRQYCLEQPCRVVEVPEVTVAVYPDSGPTRIVEMHFGYDNNREDMRAMLKNVSTVCVSAGAYAHAAKEDSQRLALLCEYLITRSEYQQASEISTPAYSLLCQEVASDAGFASVLYNTAQRSDLECYLVTGTKNDQPYCWNIVRIDGKYHHIDLMSQWLNDEITPQLYSDSQMKGYQWDTTAYPTCTAVPTADNTEPTETKNS